MKIEFTDEQFKALVMTVCYACECMDDSDSNEFGDQALALFERLQNIAPETGMKINKELMEEEDGRLSLHPEFVKDFPGFIDLYEDHREDVFWSELLGRMVGNQLKRKFGAKFNPKTIPQKEQDKIWERMEIELAENGIDNLYIKGE